MRRRRRRGSGSLYQRASDGRWVATISRGPRGERQTKSVYTRTKAEAEAALIELREQYGPMKATTLTVGAYLERWVRDARDIRDTTRRGYESVVSIHLVPALGVIHLADLSPIHVEGLLARLSTRLSPKSVRNVHVVLRRALGQAVRAGLIPKNVAAREYVDAPRVQVGEPDALTTDELEKLRLVLPGHRYEAHVLVALGTGLRQGEQLGLAWEDIDFDAGTLRVRYALAKVGSSKPCHGKYRRVDPKTPRSRRTIPLAPALVDALKAHRQRLIEAGFAPIATGPVFVNQRGGPLNGSSLTHAWYDILESAGIKRRPWKVLRATFLSRLFEMGVPDRTLADLAGHARTYTTHRHYVATGAADVTHAIERLVG